MSLLLIWNYLEDNGMLLWALGRFKSRDSFLFSGRARRRKRGGDESENLLQLMLKLAQGQKIMQKKKKKWMFSFNLFSAAKNPTAVVTNLFEIYINWEETEMTYLLSYKLTNKQTDLIVFSFRERILQLQWIPKSQLNTSCTSKSGYQDYQKWHKHTGVLPGGDSGCCWWQKIYLAPFCSVNVIVCPWQECWRKSTIEKVYYFKGAYLVFFLHQTCQIDRCGVVFSFVGRRKM